MNLSVIKLFVIEQTNSTDIFPPAWPKCPLKCPFKCPLKCPFKCLFWITHPTSTNPAYITLPLTAAQDWQKIFEPLTCLWICFVITPHPLNTFSYIGGKSKIIFWVKIRSSKICL